MARHHFLIVHGTKGSPESNWFPWLKSELDSMGHAVHAPAFPTPEGQSLPAWLDVAAESLRGAKPEETILIGHSIGAVTVLRMAEAAPSPFCAAAAVCPFDRDLGLPDYDTLNASFVRTPFDWGRVKQGARSLLLFAGRNDPYVPLACPTAIARALDTELAVVENGGHLNAEFGFTRFDGLLAAIQKIAI